MRALLEADEEGKRIALLLGTLSRDRDYPEHSL